MPSLRRRNVLGGICVSAFALAGCTSRGAMDPEDGTTTTGNGPTVGDASIETLDSTCAGADYGAVDVAMEAERVTVEGALTAPHPCHEATIEDVGTTGNRLEVVVSVHDALEEGGDCIQCVGGIGYTMSVEVNSPESLEGVHIQRAGGESFDRQLDRP